MSGLDWGVMPAENKPQDPRMKKLDPLLPKLPATFYIMGQCGSGKSSILWTLLTKAYIVGKKKHNSIFHEALVYLGTLDAKHSFEKLPIENMAIETEYDPQIFDEYMEDLKAHQMERLNEDKPALNTLLIFDDFVGAGLMKKPRPNVAPPIQKLALTSRHEASTTIFFLSQIYKNSGFSDPSIRNNITTFVVSQMSSAELDKIADELSDDFMPDEWLAHYERIMATPFNFVVYDRRRPLFSRWTEKFDKPFPPSKKSLAVRG